MKIRLGVPKGSLQEASLQLLGRAGLNVFTNGRSYLASKSPQHRSRRARDVQLWILAAAGGESLRSGVP